MNCPKCDFTNPLEMRYCGQCGTRLTSKCPECGSFNPLVFRFCGMCGNRIFSEASSNAVASSHQNGYERQAPDPPPTSTTLGDSERRIATVVVSDFTESTPLLEKVGTEEWVDLMNRILHLLENEIHRYGGEVSQFRGDGMVAVFGAGSSHEDDPERAVLAALSMQRAFGAFQAKLTQPEAANLRMRVGVHTGEVIVQSASGRQNWEEAAMGLAVAVATRLESSAEPGSILVSESTHKLITSQFEWLPPRQVNLKGVSQPMLVHQPVGVLAGSPGNSSPEIFASTLPLIGRDAEFGSLVRSIRKLIYGEGGIVTISGDKGSGKSFLLRQVKAYYVHRAGLLAESRGLTSPGNQNSTWISGRSRSYSQGWPYALWMDLFNDWFHFQPDDPKEEKLSRLRYRAEEILGDGFGEHFPYLATFLGLPLPDDFSEKIRHLDSEGLRRRFFIAIKNLIDAASRRGPMVISLADLQWADDSSLALLRYCLPTCESHALLWTLTYRSENEPVIQEFTQHLAEEYPLLVSNINLGPLDAERGLEMINSLIGVDVLPQETIDNILYKAAGNPYYILELVRSLISNGALVYQDQSAKWTVTRAITQPELPESLQQLLTARFGQLTNQQHQVFQYASVIGPVFWQNLLQTLLPDSSSLRSDLAALTSADMIERNGRMPILGQQYSFRSPLLRETAYDSLINSQRGAIHLKVAEFLETLSPEDLPGKYDGLLAYHYHGANDPKKELLYSMLAADAARKMFANTEAMYYTTRAVEVLDQMLATTTEPLERELLLTQRFEVIHDQREVFRQLGKISQYKKCSLELLSLADQLGGDPTWRVDALLARAEIYAETVEEMVQELGWAREALDLARRLGDETREMRSLIRLANILIQLKDPAWRDLAENALQLTRQLGDLRSEVNLLLTISSSYGSDDLARNREYLNTALVRSEKLNDKATELALLAGLSQEFERDGDYYHQLTAYEEKRLHISREIGNRIAEGNSLMNCGQIMALYLGDYANGLALEQEALKIWGSISGRLFIYLRIAQIQTLMGHHEEADATFDLARPLAEKGVFDIGRAGLALGTAILNNQIATIEACEQVFYNTHQIHQMTSSNLISRQYQMAASCEESHAHHTLARLYQDRDPSLAQEHKWKCLEISHISLNTYRGFGFVKVVECTSELILYRHAQALLANGYHVEAADFTRQAYHEMMRKFAFIPEDSPYQKTYLNIKLHKEIKKAFKGLKTK